MISTQPPALELNLTLTREGLTHLKLPKVRKLYQGMFQQVTVSRPEQATKRIQSIQYKKFRVKGIRRKTLARN
jgi:hypothetical protein